MLGKLSVALLVVASPALAEESAQPAEANAEAEAPQPITYKTKKICRSVEVVGSSIPKTTCRTKKIPIKPVETEAAADAEAAPEAGSQH